MMENIPKKLHCSMAANECAAHTTDQRWWVQGSISEPEIGRKEEGGKEKAYCTAQDWRAFACVCVGGDYTARAQRL